MTCDNPQTTPDENTLPMEMIPDGYEFNRIAFHYGVYYCWIQHPTNLTLRDGYGPTPRAAILAAIDVVQHAR